MTWRPGPRHSDDVISGSRELEGGRIVVDVGDVFLLPLTSPKVYHGLQKRQLGL